MADQFYGLTDTGKERSNNEDAFIARQSPDGRFIIACVIDGVGGYKGGEVAAALAREAILQRLAQPSGEIIPMLLDSFNQANQSILAGKKEVKEHDSMACVATLALADTEKNQFYYVHVGDTRLYLLRDRSLVKITHDQSFVGFLEDSGRLDEKAAMAHPKRNEINKALGFEINLSGDTDYVETGQSPFLPGDMLLLCSDGLTDMVPAGEISDILNNNDGLKDKCHDLVAAANHNGGKDNITVALVKNAKQASSHEATRPVSGQKKTELKAANEPAITNVPLTAERGAAKVKGNIPVLIFALMALIFLCTTIWQYIQRQKATQPGATPAQTDTPVIKPANAQEAKLQATINGLKGNVLLLVDTAFKSPVKISRAIVIDKDSLFIKTKGNVQLLCDSGYTGAAISLTPKCKLVMLDSLAITGFKTGVVAYNTALLLKNMRFTNCGTTVQNRFTAQGKYTNGGVPANVFKVDSIPVTPHKQK
ncbi:serine/threonine-protein phosphatase [Mucilaginibacter mali]|uniref:Serine/threonine-protein phosphatase n=1 Tax=Mucilaginibacter mali TaxID=2740462 RepID=A0A7D4Q2C5_9SPHI|nr:protein phosphatase 2C domain-containing protein [Mucilaginibacter mali]QKJ29547.1 serine/threonine-protein phosphatase [Mucilaginibacter mali]